MLSSNTLVGRTWLESPVDFVAYWFFLHFIQCWSNCNILIDVSTMSLSNRLLVNCKFSSCLAARTVIWRLRFYQKELLTIRVPTGFRLDAWSINFLRGLFIKVSFCRCFYSFFSIYFGFQFCFKILCQSFSCPWYSIHWSGSYRIWSGSVFTSFNKSS